MTAGSTSRFGWERCKWFVLRLREEQRDPAVYRAWQAVAEDLARDDPLATRFRGGAVAIGCGLA